MTVKGSGRGGRNQELALALRSRRSSQFSEPMALASAGTDGVDGPTDAAGAIVDSSTITRAAAAGLAHPSIRTFRTTTLTHFSTRLGDLIRTGPTGTNVDDLQVLLLAYDDQRRTRRIRRIRLVSEFREFRVECRVA